MYRDFPSECYSLLEHQAEAILLETSRFDERNYKSYLFLEPTAVVEAHTLEDVPRLIETIDQHSMSGGYAAGYLGYECGYAFEVIAPVRSSGQPFARFGLYDRSFIFDHRLGRFITLSPEDAGYDLSVAPASTKHSLFDPRLSINQNDYERAIEQIKFHILQGDTYQVNFTTKYHFTFDGPPLALYRDLKQKQQVSYGAFLQCGNQSIISLSPEMFFRKEHDVVTTRPIKGTVRRGRTAQEDQYLSDWLRSDPKNRAENVMIVDLLRNDLGRLAEAGSVRVTDLCTIERYATLFHLTSTIEARLKPETSLLEILRCMFPSGSITGAPKIRSMQIIHNLEAEARGVYTGAIGFIAPNREAVFNVAIRTLMMKDGAGDLGVGSGIVYDSIPHDEFAECKLKGSFLTDTFEDFALIETLLWDDGYALIESHLRRLRSSAEYFDFALDLDLIRFTLASQELTAGTRSRVRLLLQRDGTFTVTSAPAHQSQTADPATAMIVSDIRTCPSDKYLYHKTTRRSLYERKHQEAQDRGYVDAIFLNERGEVTEGAISNVFLRRDSELLTPPVRCGLLDGVYRGHVLETRRDVREEIVCVEDLYAADAVYLCNAVRGMWEVALETRVAQQDTL